MTDPNAASAPVWDELAALAAVGGDRNLALSMLTELLSSLPAELERWRRLLAADRLDDLGEAVHGCKGGAAYCGVPNLIETLAELERRALRGDRPQTKLALAAAADAISRLQRLDPHAPKP